MIVLFGYTLCWAAKYLGWSNLYKASRHSFRSGCPRFFQNTPQVEIDKLIERIYDQRLSDICVKIIFLGTETWFSLNRRMQAFSISDLPC